MSLCRKFVSEDSHAVARKKQRKWREALNIPDPNSGSQDREKKRQPYVCVASQSNRFLYCFFYGWDYNLFCREVSSGREHQIDRHNPRHRYVLIVQSNLLSFVTSSSDENSEQSEQSDDETNSQHSAAQIPSPRREDVHSRPHMPSPSRDKRTHSAKTRKEHSHSTARLQGTI